MNGSSLAKKPQAVKPAHKVRFVTAASLFDGHDASINIMRRILQASGCEVIHLGHNRSVEEIVTCALQEDAHNTSNATTSPIVGVFMPMHRTNLGKSSTQLHG